MRIVISPLAKSDLAAIRDFIAKDSPSSAARLLRTLRHCMRDTIASFPSIGQPSDELAPGLRRFPVGHYVIFYLVTDKVEIVRVLHGARDIEALFRQ